MRFSATIILSGLIASSIAAPTKRAGVLTKQSYADFQVSDGTAGNALNEVMQKFPVSHHEHVNTT
jgi:hypothetical protein